MSPMTKRERAALGAILLLAAVLRFWGITHNVWIDENKVVNPSITMAQSEGFPLAAAPQSYYPHFTHHLLALVFWPIAKASPDFSNENYHMVARVVAALFNIATIAVVYVIARRLWGYGGGILAALFLAVMPLHVKYSHFIQVDLIAAFFMMLALWSALKIWDEGTTKWYVLTGIFVGAAGASQFWGFTAGAALLLAHSKRIVQSTWNLKKMFRPSFLLALLLIPVMFTALSPHLVLQWNDYKETFEKIKMRGAAGDLGYTRANILWPLYSRSPDWGLNFTRAGLMWESNMLIFVLAIAGLILAAWQRDWRVLVMFGVFTVVLYLAINGALKLYAVKRLMPLGPLLALLAAFSIVRLPQWRALAKIVALVAVVVALVQAIGFDMAYARGSVHEQAVKWGEENIPHGSVVLQHGPLKLLDPGDERWKVMRMNEVYANFSARDPEVANDRAKSLDQRIRDEGIEYAVLDSRMVDRYYDATSRALYLETTASYRAYYDDVRARGKLLFEIGPKFGKQAGARVEIYDVRHLR